MLKYHQFYLIKDGKWFGKWADLAIYLEISSIKHQRSKYNRAPKHFFLKAHISSFDTCSVSLSH